MFGNQKINKVALSGIEPIWIKYSREADPRGVKCHFRMDDSGIFHVDMVCALWSEGVTLKIINSNSVLVHVVMVVHLLLSFPV